MILYDNPSQWIVYSERGIVTALVHCAPYVLWGSNVPLFIC